MLGQQLGIWSRDGDAGRAQGVVPEPARGGLVAIEVDDVDALSGPGVGARERDTTGGLTHPAFAAGKCEDHEKLCQGNPEIRKYGNVVSLRIVCGVSRKIRPSRGWNLETETRPKQPCSRSSYRTS